MENISFKGNNGYRLAARLDKPKGSIRAYALYAHCFTCSKDIVAASRIARALKDNGIAVVRFDFTGIGASEGDFSNTNFSSNIEDLVTAADFMRTTYQAPALIIGHSLGGAAVLAAAHKIAEIKAVVTLCSPAHVAHVAENFKNHVSDIMENGQAEVCLVGRSFTIKRQFLEDVQGFQLKDLVENLDKALLIMHSPTDVTVSINNASQLFGWAKHPKSFVSLDNADHLITRKADAEYAGKVIVAWADRYI